MAAGRACTAVTSQVQGRGRIRRNLPHVRRPVVDCGLARRATFAAVLAGPYDRHRHLRRSSVPAARRQVPQRAGRTHLTDMPDRTGRRAPARTALARPRQVLGQALHPPDVHDSSSPGSATTLRQHPRVRAQTDRLHEQMSQADGEHARAASDIQKPAIPTQTRLLRQEHLQLRRVPGAAVTVAGSRTEAGGRVIPHRTSIFWVHDHRATAERAWQPSPR